MLGRESDSDFVSRHYGPNCRWLTEPIPSCLSKRMDTQLILRRLTERLYGSPIIRNDVRGELVEEIVAAALEPEWRLCSADWASCDITHSTRALRIQVKQSAARQTWHKKDSRDPRPCFSIKEKKGRWEDGDKWVEGRSRNAEIFIFAWHPGVSSAADHRDPKQWEFFVVSEQDLPAQSSVSLSGIRRRAEAVRINGLAAKVNALAEGI